MVTPRALKHLYPTAIDQQDFVLVSNSNNEVTVHYWNEAKLGPFPSQAQIDAAEVECAADALNDIKIEYGVLGGRLINFNTTSDQVVTLRTSNSIIRRISVTGASISLTNAQGGIYTAANKGGVALVASTQAYSGLVNGTRYIDLSLAAIVGNTRCTVDKVYFSLTTPQGAVSTAKLIIEGLGVF